MRIYGRISHVSFASYRDIEACPLVDIAETDIDDLV